MYHIGGGRYKLKDTFATQRAVADYFATQEKNEKNTRLCNALLGLIDQVLFVPDPVEPGKYHPRISAQFTYTYRSLNDYERWCFDRLYNDFFYRRHNDFWYGKAMWKLPPLIDSTSMLTCAEDLGMIPGCVPAVLSALQILTLEIQRMPKDPNQAFGNTWGYPYYSVCTTSTHDMGGIRAWWEDDRAASSKFFHEVLHEPGQPPLLRRTMGMRENSRPAGEVAFDAVHHPAGRLAVDGRRPAPRQPSRRGDKRTGQSAPLLALPHASVA